MMEGTFAILDHPADLKLRFRAGTLDGLLGAAARALREYLYEDPREGPEYEVYTTADGTDEFGIFIVALNEILYSLQTRGLLVREVRADRKAQIWDLVLIGNKARTGASREIKAATYHDGYLREGPEGWEAEVIFDV